MNKKLKVIALSLLLSLPISAYAGHGGGEEEALPVSNISYYDLAPEIVTNYSAPGRKIGFIRLKVQLMTENPADIPVLEYHAPYIRDIVISILHKKTPADFSSAKGFDDIRRECKAQIEEFLQKEEGRKVIRELLFTNTIWE